MSDLFDGLIGPLLAVEGGYVSNPADPGGETNFGITAIEAKANGYAGALKAMSRDQAVAIYRARYWIGPRLHQVAPLSAAVAGKLFDMGVNMGPPTGIQLLQRALNVLNRGGKDYPDIMANGVIAAPTLDAFGRFLALRGKTGEQVLLKALNGLQVARYVAIAEARPASEAFEFGWLANRIAAVV